MWLHMGVHAVHYIARNLLLASTGRFGFWGREVRVCMSKRNRGFIVCSGHAVDDNAAAEDDETNCQSSDKV